MSLRGASWSLSVLCVTEGKLYCLMLSRTLELQGPRPPPSSSPGYSEALIEKEQLPELAARAFAFVRSGEAAEPHLAAQGGSPAANPPFPSISYDTIDKHSVLPH